MLRTFDPFAEMSRLSDELNRRLELRGPGQATYRPAVDIFEDQAAIRLLVDLPGVRRDDLHINLERNLLTLTGERKHDLPADETLHRTERTWGTFMRSFALPDTVDPSGIEANLKEGVLTLMLPKRAEVQPRKIEISVAG